MMNDWSWLLGIPVLLPFIGAALCLLFVRHPTIQRAISVATLTVVCLDACAITWLVRNGPITLDVGGWSAPVGITLVGDRLSALMLLISVAVTLAVLLFSLPQDIDESQRIPIAVYQPTFLILSAGVSNAFLTGDLFNLYVGFEILLIASFVLITLGGTRDRMRAGSIYVIVSVFSSVIFLTALAMVYAAVGTVNLAQIALRLPEIDPVVASLIQAMLFIAFGVKAAVFPLSAWLPDSYPTAPAPVTAVFAGLLTKVGVYAIIRTQTIVFADRGFHTVISILGAITMVIGILGAIAQDDLKRLLSFTLVSHIGFMLWGVGSGSVDGYAAAIFYTAHHIIVQTALFLVTGLIEWKTRTTSLIALGSMLATSPFIAIVYFIPALNLAGLPPFSGFIGKIGLISASAVQMDSLSIAMIATGVLSSFLTLYVLIRAWNMIFWQKADEEIENRPLPPIMTISTAALVILSTALSVFGGPAYSYARRAAVELQAQVPYVVAVFPDAQRGTGQSHTENTIEPNSDLAPTIKPPLPTASPSAKPSSSIEPTPSPSPQESR